MITEEYEFLISQYVDGTISAADRAVVESRLSADNEARLLAEEYRRLHAILRSAPPVQIDWDAFSQEVSDAIDGQQSQSYRFRIGWAGATGLAMAASFMLAVGLWLNRGQSPVAHSSRPAIQVAVLGPELPAGPGIQQIDVGPPPGQTSSVISEALVTQPQSLFIAKVEENGQDTSQGLY